METQKETKAKEIMNKFYGNFMPHYAHNEVFDRCFRAKYADILEAMQLKDEKFQKVLDYAETCYGVFSFEQREKFIKNIKKIYYGKE